MSNFPSTDYSPSPRVMLLAMLASITAVGITLGITAPLFSLVLNHMGLSSALIGLNTSFGIGATLIMAPLVPRLLGRMTPVNIMFGGILLSAGGLVIAGFIRSAGLWFLLRFIIGVGISLHWVISETCINHFSSEANRGLIAGVYSALLGLGFAVGPVVLQATGVEGPEPFLISAGLVLAAALPLGWVRKNDATGAGFFSAETDDMVNASVLRLAPIIMLASLISGFMDSATLALLPLYGLGAGMGQGGAVGLLAIVAFGAVALQLPLGWIADRLGRRETLLACAAASVVTGGVIPLVFDMTWLLDLDLFLWGGFVVAFYTLALTLLGSFFRGPFLARASSTLVMAYCLGSVAGPALVGAVMDAVGSSGFVWAMVIAPLVLVVAAALRLGHERF